jgi:hypothetical protein
MSAGGWLRRHLETGGPPRKAVRRSIIALLILVGVLIAIRIVLDPIATYFTRRELQAADGIRGDLQRVHVTLFPPGYEIHRLKIVQHPPDDWKHPLVFVERLSVTPSVRALLHARLAAKVRLDGPKLIITNRPAAHEKTKEAPLDVGAALRKAMPASIDRIEVRDGELLFRDLTAPRHPEIWVHAIELAAENITTRAGLAGGRPTTVSASGKLGRSGDLSLFASANPFAKALDFAGSVELRGWKVAELYDLEEPKTKLQTPEGTLDLFAEFKAHGGEITGGVKPVLKNVKVRPTEDGFGNKLKAWVADTGLHLFSDRVPGRNAVVTIIPIKGRLDQPDIQLWPAILGVIRNAFVEGISSGFAHVPPPESDKKEGPLTQVKHALEKDKGPPKAQPDTNAPRGEDQKAQK